MTEQNQTPTPNTVQSGPPIANPAVQTTPVSSPPTPTKIYDKIKPFLINLFNKFSESGFYANKKIFWPITVAFGLMFLIIILGLIFGKRTVNISTSKTPSPVPFVQATPQASTSGDILIDSQTKLDGLKNDINNLDVEESRLKPPTLNFDVKF